MATIDSDLAKISAFGPARASVEGTPLSEEELNATHSSWRACCYLILGMLYLGPWCTRPDLSRGDIF